MKRAIQWFWVGVVVGMVLGVTILQATPSARQAFPSVKDSLTLRSAWWLLLQNNLTLKQQQAALEKARALYHQVQTNRLPTLQAGGSYRYISDIPQLELPIPIPGVTLPQIEAGAHNQYDLFLQVVQPVFTGFRLRNVVKMQKHQVESMRIATQRVQQQLLFQVGQLYYTYQLNLLQQRVVAASIRRIETGIARSRALFAHQQITAFDTLRFVNQRLRLVNQFRNLKRQNEMVLSQLRVLLNKDSLPTPKQKLEGLDFALQPEGYYQNLARQNRPELQEVHFRKQVALLGQRVAKAAYFPQISAYAAVHYGNPGANFFRKEWNVYTLAGLQFSFDVWNWGRTYYQVQEAAARMRQLSLEDEKLLQQIQSEVHTTYLQLLQIQEEQAYLQRLVEQEMLRYQLVQHKYQVGMATSLDLQEAESALTTAQLQLEANRIAWLKLKLKMDLVTGTIGKNLEGNHE